MAVSCMMVADYCTTNYYILLLPGFLSDTLPIEAAQVAWPNHTHKSKANFNLSIQNVCLRRLPPTGNEESLIGSRCSEVGWYDTEVETVVQRE